MQQVQQTVISWGKADSAATQVGPNPQLFTTCEFFEKWIMVPQMEESLSQTIGATTTA